MVRIKRKFIRSGAYSVVALILLVATGASCQAQNLFSFIQEGTEDVLAKLELSNLPATTLADIAGFEFTEAGNAIFGLGVGPYAGEFDSFTGGELDISSEGILGGTELSSDGAVTLGDATSSPLTLTFFVVDIQDTSDDQSIRFVDSSPEGTEVGGTATGKIELGDATIADSTIAEGNWHVVVPEPTSLCLLLGLLGQASLLRCR